MTPDEVPADLVEKAARGIDASHGWKNHTKPSVLAESAARHALAAVLPEYGATVLEEALPIIEVSGPFGYAAVEDMAARLRGES